VLSDCSSQIWVVVYFVELGEHEITFWPLHELFTLHEFLVAVSPEAGNKTS
jgi:hypothetical protein